MRFSHFVAQITDDGGPNPSRELRRLTERSQTDPQHIAWFKSPLGDNEFDRAGNSICIIFRKTGYRDSVEAVVARIRPLRESGLVDEDDKNYYAGWPNLKNWWPLGGFGEGKTAPDIALATFGSIDDIPGWSWETRNSARETFGGRCTVSGWEFPDGFNPLGWLRERAAQTN
jgi:hypothetical protein